MNTTAQSRPSYEAVATRRLQGLAAIVAGPLFLSVVAILTVVELDYLHALGWGFTSDDEVPWPSGLVLGSYGAVQIVNFALAAALLAFFADGLRRELPASKLGRAAGVAVTAIPLALALAAFPTDHATVVTQEPDTWHGWLHVIGFVALAISSLVAPLLTALVLRRDARWRPLAALSIAALVLEVVFFIPLDFLGDPAFVGYLVVLFGWFAALGIRLRTLATT